MNKIRKLFAIIGMVLLLTSCGGNTINGKFYEPYGVANEEANRDPNVVYEISAASVIWGIIFCETIFIPVYIIGWDLMRPVKMKVQK
jgi:hypothetical protein